MNYVISLYNLLMDFYDKYELQITWYVLGIISVTIVIMLLNAYWVAAAIYAGLTYLNFYINKKVK